MINPRAVRVSDFKISYQLSGRQKKVRLRRQRMKFIIWQDEKYSVGNEIIDNQHKQLISIINELHALLRKNQYQEEAVQLIKQLNAYTEYHFLSEEGLFKEYKVPNYSEHIQHHNEFRNKIKEAAKRIRQEPFYPIEKLLKYLVEWILMHVQKEDKAYSEFFKSKAIVPNIHFSISEEKKDNIIAQWDSRQLSLEIGEIDTQHKELIYILQQTNDLQYTSDVRKKIYLPIIIKKLFYYSRFHFLYEEDHMAKHNYPGLEEHKKLHISFIEDIQKFAADYRKGKRNLTDNLILYIKDWTVNHILGADKEYKNFIST